MKFLWMKLLQFRFTCCVTQITLSYRMQQIFFASAIYVAFALKSTVIIVSFLSKLILVSNSMAVWFLID